MASCGLCFVLVVLIVQICVVYVQGEIIKSSLTFVIDYTLSMTEEIRSVKEEVSIIFDKVLSSKASQIENFVIVIFNDPNAELLIITKDPNEFKKALESIRLNSDNNFDCPEYAMTGIELGLTNSLPLSYLYVFTDASASDYDKLEQIKSLSQKKQSQVVFLLTGLCGSTSDPEYQAYHQVAQASGGQVFHMMKNDVKDILKYIEESITSRGVTIRNDKYPPGTHKVKFNVDSHIGAVLISLTGLNSRIGEVTGPGGIKSPTEPIVSGKANMAVRRLNNAKLGDYEVEIEGRGEVHIIMIAKSDLNFQLGFSVDSPTSLKDTVTRPPPAGDAFLGIRLLGEGVELTTAKILDLDDKVIAELPLTLVDKKEQFYVTPSFDPPYSIFLVTVIGNDLKTGTPVVRTGPTPIARQNPLAEPAVNTAPEITIQGAPKIIAEYDAPLKLKCYVHGYPAPDIVWSEKDTGIVMPAKMHSVDVPYDYVSILEINIVNKNMAYQCEARNAYGTSIKYVEVERRIYFDVIEAPKDIRVEYAKEGSIVCKMDAYPPATIAWYKDGAEFSGNTNIDISSDKSILGIKNMQPELQGEYTCEAKNALDRKVFIANVAIFGVEEPVIDKLREVERVTETTNAELSCRILKGIPKPAIRWSFKSATTGTSNDMTETTEIVHLNNVRKDQTGTYRCTAQNALGSDSFTMELVVEYPPKIKENDKIQQINDGDEVRIPCDVTGEPAPTVRWVFKGTRLESSAKILISSDHSIKFKAAPSDIGDYTCEAENKFYTAKKTVSLDVLEAPVIDKTHNEIRVTEKTNAALSCSILQGNPKPSILWSFQPAGLATSSDMTETTEIMHLNNVRKDQTGTYKCTAQNTWGSDSFTTKLVVEFPPIIEKDDKVKQIKDGDEVRMTCDATGEPAPTVNWFFRGAKLTSSTKFSVSSDYSIKFKATPSDIGDYTCEAVNKLNTAKKIVSLEVLDAPVIDKTHNEIRVTEKTNAALSCSILQGNPKPSILWSFQPAGLATSSDMTETTEIVHLNNVRKDQTGTYKCTAQNTWGSDSFTTKLVVEFPPIIEKDDKVKQIKDGDEVRMTCDATGEPAPTVNWFFRGAKLTSSTKFSVSSDYSIKFKATPSDIGDYTCEAVNKLNTAKKIVSLEVLDAPVIDKTHNEIRVTEKTNAALSCSILQGNPKPSILWSFQPAGLATSSDMTETTEIVHLNNVRKDQTGTYKCTAQNTWGSDSFTTKLVVEFPPIIEKDDKVKQIKDGDEVRMTCDATGEPAPTVNWFFRGTKLTSSTKFSVSSDYSIKFKATPSDIGDYTCEAVNKLNTAKKIVSLEVLDAPVIDKTHNEIRVTEKTNAALSCSILQGNPKPSILWSFQPAGLATSSVMTETTEIVHFNNVRKDQTGTYKCTAQNTWGSDSFTTKLIVEFPPIIEKDDKVKQIKDGDEVRMTCDATGEPAPTVNWFFRGTKLTSSTKFSVSSDYSIKFKATPSDIGDYTCEAVNKLNTAKKIVSLEVLDAPVIDKTHNEIRVTEKTNAALSCSILQGNPKPSILWSFQPAGLATSSVMTETTEIVHFNNVRKDQTGTYKCTAQNTWGSDSFTTKLIVEFPPIIEKDDKVKQIKDGDEVRMTCDATGEPAPTVNWFFRGTKLTSSTKFSVSSDYSIKFKATPSDIGDYTCEAVNKLNTAKKIVSLEVLDAPVIDKTHNEIRVTEKTNAALSCSILQGNPKPSILWSFQPAGLATSSDMTETTEIVHLNNVRKDQTGTYKCTAKNTWGSDSFTTKLIVEFPPIIEKDDKVKQIKDGDEVRMTCDATGEPAPTVNWFFRGAKLTSSTKFSVSSDYSIKFKATPSDIGDYTCEAVNKLNTAKKIVSLEVLDAPVIDKTHNEIRVTEKTNAALSCSILQGNPKPSILWSFQPAGLATSSVMTETTEIVHFNNVRKDQTGTYKCTAQNTWGSDSFTTKLIVEFPPIIEKDDKVKQIKDGDEVRMTCDATGEPAPTVNWFFRGTKLTSSTKFSVSSDYSIKFKATPSDIGDYTCEAVNKLNTAKKIVSLEVLDAPVIDKTHNEIRVTEKTNAALSCSILQGNPKPSILWSFQPAGLATSSDMTETTEIVHLNNVRKDQTGTYKCTAKNTWGSDSFTTKLIVEFPPIIEKDDKVKQIKDGDEVRMTCDATGEPAPTVNWFFRGAKLTSSTKFSVSSDYSIKFKATPSDIGDYTCEAVNKLNTAKKIVSLEVLDAPVIDKTHNEIRVTEKTNAALSCSILQGNPKPSILWSFQPAGLATSSDMTETTEIVHLNNVRKDQTGTYKCTAQNTWGSDSFTTKLIVEFPPIIEKDDKVKQIKDGDEVRMTCDATGEPAPTVNWFFRGTKLTSSTKFSVSSDYSIKFKATPSDIGDYTCEAVNKLNTAKKIVSLEVLDAPVIDKTHNEIRVTEKTNAALSCSILQGNPKPSILWSFQPAGLATSSVMTETTEIVHFNNVRKDQTGTYKCTAQNTWGSDSFTTKLIVEFPPIIEKDDKVKQIKDGDEVRMTCDATGEPAPTVNWFFRGTKLTSSTKFSVSSDYSIKFKATPSDIGDYTCEAVNKLNTAKKIVSLEVLDAPVIDKTHNEIRVTEKTNAALSCSILQGNPKPSILWSFQPAGLATSSVMTETTEIVHFNNVRKDQTGTYKCTAQNTWGSDSFTTKLIVEFPPIIEKDDKVKQIKDGDEVRMTCDATGEPAPTVNWFFRGTKLTSSTKFSVSSDYSIKFKATPSDIGDYTCEAVNKLNTAKKIVSLEVLDAPVIDKTHNEIRVTEKTNAALSCSILQGNPKPSILWSFQPAGLATSSDMTETTEIVHLNNVRKDQTGTYKCTAKNTWGSDSFTTKLIVEFPPIIEKDDKVKQIKDGDEVRMTCDATGEPAPTVNWFFRGAKLTSSTKFSVSSDYSIKFKATPSDIGDYTCEAVNKLNTAKKIVSLEVLDAPVIDKTHNEIRVTEKTNAALSCSILQGNPKPSILWSFQPAGLATSSVMTETTEIVHFNNVRKDQTGTYKCTAQNTWGSDSFTTKLIVEFPPIIEKDDKVKQIKDGDEVRMTCDATGEPAPTVNWFFRGTKLTSSTKFSVSSDYSIKFKATPSDIGDYTCEAVNKLNTAKKIVSLEVLDAPVIDKTHNEIRVTEKTNAALSCSILQGNPKPSILWSFQPAGLATSSDMTETTEIVHLNNVRKDQTGTYKCTAKNTWGSDSFTTKLIVEFPPIIEKDDKVKQIKDGDEVRMTCDATGEPAPTVNWFFRGAKLTSSTKFSVSSDYSIKFKATPSDIGDYTCEAVNKLNTAKKIVSLEVLDAPVIDKTHNEIRVTEKTNAALSCSILQGNPKPSILWSFQPAGLATSSDMTETTEIVHLNNVRKDQTGTYKCTAQNTWGSDSFTTKLIVEFPPIIEKDDKVKQIKDGDEVRMTCDATGEPAPTVNWFFRGTKLTSSTKFSVSSDYSIKFKATPSDIGDYTCEAVNKLNTAKKIVSLEVLDAPVIDKTHNEIRVTEKTNAALSCSILQGNPKPSILWSFQPAGLATSSDMTETTEIVHLNNVRKDQTGTYKCTAKNTWGSDSFTTKLIVEFPPIIEKDDKVKQIKDGDEVRMTCNATGEPAPTVNWFFRGAKLTSSTKFSVSSDYSIKFKATPSDIGDYTCEAVNKLNTAKKIVSLEVLDAPVIDKTHNEIRVTEKTNAALSCSILQGNPKPSILWSFQPAGLATSSVMTETTEIVHFNNVRKDQTGTYKCTAQNTWGSDSFTTKLIVEFPPIIEKDDKVKQIKDGDEVRMTCDATGEPAPTVNWFFRGTKLTSSTKFSVSSDYSIKFKATPSDIGDYTCEAVNKLNTAKKIVSLEVLDAPVIDKTHNEIRVTEKTNAALSCSILQGNPKPSILWSFQPAGLATSSVMTETTEIVHFNNVRKDQTGTYKCTAQNTWGSDSFTTKLIVEFPPIIEKDDKVKQIKDGDEVRMTCDATGEPAPTVNWFFRGTKLTSSTKFSVSSDYSIKFKATPSDIGDYTCEAVNKLNTAKKIVSLEVLDAPVIDKTHNEIRVTEKTNAALSCSILQGNPKPSILWSFQPAGLATSSDMTETTEIVHLNNVRKDQTGTYKCTAKNTWGSDSFTTKLIVEFPPIIEKDDKVKQIKDGDEVRMTCDATGEPAPTVNWFFRGAKLTSSTKFSVSSDYSIKFKATPSDIGDYTCEAVNKLNTAKKIVSLEVLDAPVIDKTHNEIRVTEKTNAALSCSILQGNPKPSILWSFQPAGLATSSVMTETTEIVHFNNVRKDQTGTYKCTAQNTWGSDSFTTKLIVEFPPIIQNHIKVKPIKDGDVVRIPCDVTGEPAPTVKWFFKGIRLTSSAKISVSTDFSIKFKATPSDIGYYTCEAENRFETVKKTVFLDVLEVPVIDKSLTEIRVPEKSNTVLSCKILQGNPKPSIRWSFKSETMGTSNDMTETTETVHLKNVHKDQTGTYDCSALNAQGSDSFAMKVVVEYPPIIKKDMTLIQIKDGDKVRISCDVTGEPAPEVKWFFYDPRLGNTAKDHKSSDHSFRFEARVRDIGFYRCEARNKLGSAKKTTELQVYIPVTIETPMNSNIETMVGDSETLNCQAGGYPRPDIKWTFQSSDPKIPAKDITPTGGVASVDLRNLQLDEQGSYTCEAENVIGGSASITYDVTVYAPPVIVNTYPFKNFEAMVGDVALRIQCKTTGRPKPSIVWMKNGLNLAMGTKWYDMENDGTLIIKNIDRESEGSYVCHAGNFLGNVNERYEATVIDNVVPAVPTSTIFVKEGETVNINCDIPHSRTDQMRWYKDSLAVANDELTLYSVTRRDDGLYTCRVSNPYKSRSVTTKVVVGYKPEFATKEKEIVEFVHGTDSVFLSCEAYGQPRPTTATWKHNGKILVSTDMSYPLGMVYGATGTYECEVSNAFGSIRRAFKVTSRDCILDIKKDFTQKQPIMLSQTFTWPMFPVNDGYMTIPHGDYFYLHCPSLFSNPTLPEYPTAFCERDNTIKINGKIFNFADIQCNEEVKPQVSRSGIPCLSSKTEILEIGYKVKSTFLGVFEVCLDTKNNVPLYTKHNLSPHHTDSSTEAAWSNSLLPQDFDTLYDCSRQMYDITSALGRGLSTHDSCCFGKRQLVSSHNLLPGVPTSSAYDYLNVIPHWSTCNSKNWEDVEQSVKNLVKSAGYDLIISTGTANPRRGGASTDITLQDDRGGKQLVAPYLWKVVQDRDRTASLVIIQINIPELTAAEASKHVLCPDICGAGISWIEPSNWQNVDDGYTYCCSIIEFEKAFGYIGRFSPLMKNVFFSLKD